MKVLLLHAPKELRHRGQLVGYEIMALAHGLLPLAAKVRDAGHQVSVLHLGLERQLDASFRLADHLRQAAPDVVGLSLQWHAQLAHGLAAARDARRAVPGAHLVAGGLAASRFAAELLRTEPALDSVIRGDAEQPLPMLLERLERGGGALDRVPNLSWRDGQRARHNPLSYQIEAAELDALEVDCLELLRHHRHYSGHDRLDCAAQSLRAQAAFPVFHLPVGRGCTASCAFCGGGAGAHLELSGRAGPVLRSPRRVAEVMQQVVRRGIRFFFISFDLPGIGRRWQRELFEQVARRQLKVGAFWELYHQPPDEALMEAFAGAFIPRMSVLALSPHTASASQRRRHGGPPRQRQDYDRALTAARDRGLRTACYFTSFPGESWDQAAQTAAWALDLARAGTRVEGLPIELEPCAPWEADPDAYGMQPGRQGLDQYLSRHKQEDRQQSLARRLGYSAPELEPRALLLRSVTEDARPAALKVMGAAGSPTVGQVVHAAAGGLRLATQLAEPGATYLLQGCADAAQLREALGLLARQGANPAAVHCVRGPQLLLASLSSSEPAGLRSWQLELVAPGRELPRSQDQVGLWYATQTSQCHQLAHSSKLQLARTADACRWLDQPCPAADLQRLLVDAAGQVRPCLAWPAEKITSHQQLEQLVRARCAATERQRGCDQCPARRRCSRCPCCGPLEPDEFCQLMIHRGGG